MSDDALADAFTAVRDRLRAREGDTPAEDALAEAYYHVREVFERGPGVPTVEAALAEAFGSVREKLEGPALRLFDEALADRARLIRAALAGHEVELQHVDGALFDIVATADVETRRAARAAATKIAARLTGHMLRVLLK